VNLDDYAGHVVLIDFWSSWCPFCIDEAPYTQALAKKYASQGLITIGYDGQEDFSDFQDYVSSNTNLNSITFLWGDNSPADAYGVNGIPTEFVIDKSGNIAAVSVGFSATDTTVENAIVAALATPSGHGAPVAKIHVSNNVGVIRH